MLKELIESKQFFLFDAFGTLFKTSNFTAALEERVGKQSEQLISIWRSKQLQYT